MNCGEASLVMASQAQQVLGDYLLIELVGEGGMAEVFRAQHQGRAVPGQEDEVVLKRIKPELFQAPEFPIFREMFMNEAKLVHGLSHPNLARMHTLGEGLDRSLGVRIPFIVGEYIRGKTLRKYLHYATWEFQGRGVSPAIATFIIREVARGLGAAHVNKDARSGKLLPIIHRDVAPDNVMISLDGKVKVIDFGVAKAIGGFGPQTQTGIIKGKLAYMAPEQVAQKVVPATDVFGAGIMLHEMLTGRRLFGGSNDFVVVSKVLKAEIPRPSELIDHVPPELEAVLMRALSRDLSVRYVNGNAFADALTEVMKHVPALRGINELEIKRWTEGLLAEGSAALPTPPVEEPEPESIEEEADHSGSGEIELSGEDVMFGGMQDVNPAIREAVTQGLRAINLEMMHKSSEPTQPVPKPLLSESTARFVPPALHEHERAPGQITLSPITTAPQPALPKISARQPARSAPTPSPTTAPTTGPLTGPVTAPQTPPARANAEFFPVPNTDGQPVPDLGPAATMRLVRYAGYAGAGLVLLIIIVIFLVNW